MILNRLTEFYDDFFQYHYEKQKTKDSDPEAFPIFLTSFCQGTNILILLIVLYYTTDLNKFLDKQQLAISIIPLYLILGGIHIYRFVWKKQTEKIIKRNKTIDKKMKWYSNAYVILSIWFPLLLIYFFNEIY
jgi:hypothetical protein